MTIIRHAVLCSDCLGKIRGTEAPNPLEFNEGFFDAGVCDECGEITLVSATGLWVLDN